MHGWQKITLGLLIAGVLALAALPWWLGALAPLIGRQLHAETGSYERIGYTRFMLRQVAWREGNVRVAVERVEADTPLLWLWRHWRGTDAPVVAEGWLVDVSRSDHPSSRSRSGIAPLHGQLQRIAAALGRWLPRAALRNGRVRWPGGGFVLGEADWRRTTLAVRLVRWAGSAPVAGRAEFKADGTVAVEASEPGRQLRCDLRWTGTGSAADVAGRLWAWDQPVVLRAHYVEQGWLPAEGTAEVARASVPPEHFGLASLYGPVRGAARAEWRDGRFQISIDAQADPVARGAAPPAILRLKAEGDRQAWSVTALRLQFPFADADLSAPVSFGYASSPQVRGANLRFSGDLARLFAGGGMQGKVAGRVEISGGLLAVPDLDFDLEAKDVLWRKRAFSHVAAEGSLHDFRLSIRSAEALGAGANLRASGDYDLRSRVFSSVRLAGVFSGGGLRPWLPAGIAMRGADFSLTASGAWPSLAHAGRFHLERAEWALFNPVEIDGQWRGTAGRVDAGQIRLAAGETQISLAGAVDARGAELRQLRWTRDGTEIWRLERPSSIGWSPSWRIGGLRLAGPAAHASLSLLSAPGEGAGGSIDLALSEVRSEWFSDLLRGSRPPAVLHSLSFRGHFENGRLVFSARAAAGLLRKDLSADLALALAGDASGTRLDEARVFEGGQTLAEARGRLPVEWSERAPHLRIETGGPLNLEAEMAPKSSFWNAFARSFGATLEEPRVRVRLTGTLDHPAGELEAGVARLKVAPGGWSGRIPALEQLEVRAHADRAAITLDRLTGRIAGQPITAAGRLPMSAVRWRGIFSDRGGGLWREASAHLDVAEADLAPLAAYLPGLAARGRWELHVALDSGKMRGRLRVRGAAAGPFGSFGFLQAVTADVALDDRSARIRTLTAEIGGRPVRAEGDIDWLPARGLRYSFRVRGQDLPLLRQPGFLLRADVDVRGEPTPSGGTRLTGLVAVRDGLLLGDLSDLLPKGIEGGPMAPPYFSIETEPFARWSLAVDLRAAHTLRIRTTLFNGTASGQFRLSGTLREPHAVGQVTIDQGQVSLPFASFLVGTGAVRLTPEDPYHPTIDLSATARRYDYDLHMDVTGLADSPTVTFTSNPALPSDQVLLLVMAGQVPVAGTVVGGASTQMLGLGTYFGQSLLQGFSGGGSNRLEVSSGQELSEKNRPTYEVEYRLSDRWRLVGEYDQFDDYDAGVKWRAYRDSWQLKRDQAAEAAQAAEKSSAAGGENP